MCAKRLLQSVYFVRCRTTFLIRIDTVSIRTHLGASIGCAEAESIVSAVGSSSLMAVNDLLGVFNDDTTNVALAKCAPPPPPSPRRTHGGGPGASPHTTHIRTVTWESFTATCDRPRVVASRRSPSHHASTLWLVLVPGAQRCLFQPVSTCSVLLTCAMTPTTVHDTTDRL